MSLRELVNETTGPAGAEYSESTRPVDRVYEDQARLQETLTAVAALPELQRRALLATAVDGLSYDQIADQLDTSSDAVRGLVHRARNTLRTGIAAVFPGPLVVWAANQVGPNVSSGSVQQWVSEATVGGGSVGMGAALTKGAVVLASSAAVVTGGVGAKLATHAFAPGGNPSQGLSTGGHGPAHSASAANPTTHPAIGVASHTPITHGGHGPVPDRSPAPKDQPSGSAHGFVPTRQGSRLTAGRAPSGLAKATTGPRSNSPQAPAGRPPGGAAVRPDDVRS
jgi:DNA-binding CsgD family transcriptional regulator